MLDRLVIDTGPLIALAHADALDIAARLPLELLAPDEVAAELEAGRSAGHVAVDASFVRFVSLQAPLHPVVQASLGRGEAAVIQLALDQKVQWVCVDELRGRSAAAAAGLSVTGTLGLLAKAKILGLVGA